MTTETQEIESEVSLEVTENNLPQLLAEKIIEKLTSDVYEDWQCDIARYGDKIKDMYLNRKWQVRLDAVYLPQTGAPNVFMGFFVEDVQLPPEYNEALKNAIETYKENRHADETKIKMKNFVAKYKNFVNS